MQAPPNSEESSPSSSPPTPTSNFRQPSPLFQSLSNPEQVLRVHRRLLRSQDSTSSSEPLLEPLSNPERLLREQRQRLRNWRQSAESSSNQPLESRPSTEEPMEGLGMPRAGDVRSEHGSENERNGGGVDIPVGGYQGLPLGEDGVPIPNFQDRPAGAYQHVNVGDNLLEVDPARMAVLQEEVKLRQEELRLREMERLREQYERMAAEQQAVQQQRQHAQYRDARLALGQYHYPGANANLVPPLQPMQHAKN